MNLKLEVNDKLPLREIVMRTLRRAIIEGEFKPGERLMEETIARKLGVSRTPVREAIKALEQEGLVVMKPRCGAEVANITIKDLKDALEVRLALESLSVKLACERLDSTSEEKIKEKCIAFREAINSKLVPAIVKGDEDFHNAIYEASKNPKLIGISQNLRELIYRFRTEYIKDFSYHDKLVREHDEIAKAIIKGDVEKAQEVMRVHIYDQEQIVIRNLKRRA